ncbi:trypsin-like serine protease [Neiella marina]|uniref:Trypsin-like serine protease n=1 Tax=Neiella holothuriorum TaxID=2870530 RepID=A0ABS7EK65_9GAMM|nr:trypsin-like serine protease [Neiella holothuriorum]MBW8192724.1 trypsin-like serine protease [Neiella holothuriorum]
MRKYLALFVVFAWLAFSAQSFATSLTVKIIGGDPIGVDDYGWLASLHYIGPNGQFIEQSQHFCAGMQISESWVVTAAHCTEAWGMTPSDIGVAIGIEQQSDIDASDLVLVSQIIVHPDYDDVLSDNDIALLKLEQSNELSGYATLASDSQTSALDDGEELIIIGWGDTEDEEGPVDQLMQANVAYVGPSQCQAAFSRTGLDVTDNMICAGGNYDADSCFGDSGGPLMDADLAVHGITSWGVECAGEYPSGYTRVANYSSWIEQITAGLSATSPEYFGLVPFGQGAMKTLTVTNHSPTATITIGEVSLAGSAYSLVTDDCSSQTLAAQSECVLEVAFDAQSLNSTAGVISVPNALDSVALTTLTINLTADVAAQASFSSTVVPTELAAFSYGQITFGEDGSELKVSLSESLQETTDLLLQAEQDGTLSFDVDLSDEDGQSLWVSELNGEVLATYYPDSSANDFSYRLAAGDVIHLEYSVSSVGTATLSNINFEADQASSGGSSADSSSSGGGGAIQWGGLLSLLFLVGLRRRLMHYRL